MINEFRGKHAFISNFWHCNFKYKDRYWTTSEHAFQAEKAEDREEYERIAKATTAAEAKRLGKRVKLRKDWESVKINIMRGIVRAKFAVPELRQMLLDTGDEELVEGNDWGDTFWGVCKGRGSNWLGKILMEVRSELK